MHAVLVVAALFVVLAVTPLLLLGLVTLLPIDTV
jgi:hypothetical protein